MAGLRMFFVILSKLVDWPPLNSWVKVAISSKVTSIQSYPVVASWICGRSKKSKSSRLTPKQQILNLFTQTCKKLRPNNRLFIATLLETSSGQASCFAPCGNDHKRWREGDISYCLKTERVKPAQLVGVNVANLLI